MSEYTPAPGAADANREDAGKKVTQLVYILQAVGMFLGGLPILVGIIINYVKRDDVRGTLWESHFRWQIRTFWFSLLWTVVGFVLMFVVVGWLVLVANTVWTIYRAVKGWLYLNDGKAMY
ncbi:DUF4870 family protein [Castellaniella caeni]|uniref:DUF4870 family protein n=1 Tax=Castellaniella caeni TaxID=266123 RepID=UPI00082E1E94|nr:hypothetical protein [Castellaniella caeni]